MTRCVIVALLAGAVLLLAPRNRISAQQSTVNSKQSKFGPQEVQERSHPAPSTQTIYAPLGLEACKQAEIVLNNNSPENMDVTAAFYTDENPVAGQTVTLKPAEVRNMLVRDLMPLNRALNNLAGMTLTYFGGMLEVGAQITLPGEEGAGSIDIPFSAAMDYRSRVQEAVWWMPRNARATIIVGNASDVGIVAALKYSNGDTTEIYLEPFDTQILVRESDAKTASSAGTAQSIRVEISGPVGSLRATGFVRLPSRRFSGNIRFFDPATIRQPHLFATNLRLDKKEPRLVLKNVGDETLSARPRFVSVSGKSGGVVELPAVGLGPHQETEVDLNPLTKVANVRSDFDLVSVQIINDSGVNNLIGALYSTDLKSKTTYEVPLRDSGPVRNSTGSYPWRIDEDYSTIISITNTQEKTSRYLVTISYEGGQYSLDPVELGEEETVVFNLRKIRDEQLPDKDGNFIPHSIDVGQFRWSLIGDDTYRLIGRSEIVSLSKRVSSSYSCPVCCPDSFNGLEITPESSTGAVGGTTTLAVNGLLQDCYGFFYGPYAWSVSSWSIENPSVISLAMVSQGSAQMGCLTVGQSQFYGTTFEVWYDNDGMDCYSRYGPFDGGCCGTVFMPELVGVGPTLMPGENNAVISGQAFTLQIQARVPGSNPPQVVASFNTPVTVSFGTMVSGESISQNPVSMSNGVGTTQVVLKVIDDSFTPSCCRTFAMAASGATSTTGQLKVWFPATMDIERWKNCNFSSCPNLGSYVCTSACVPQGFPAPYPFIALTADVCGANVIIKNTANGATQSTVVLDLGPSTGNAYWNTGSIPSIGGCISDSLADSLGVPYGCNPNVGQGSVLWRFQ